MREEKEKGFQNWGGNPSDYERGKWEIEGHFFRREGCGAWSVERETRKKKMCKCGESSTRKRKCMSALFQALVKWGA